jgi:hypothetical protein
MTKTEKLELENAKLKELVALYSECLSSSAHFLHIHNYNESEENIKKGKRLREKLFIIQSVIPQEEEDKRKTLITDYHKKIRDLILEESNNH